MRCTLKVLGVMLMLSQAVMSGPARLGHDQARTFDTDTICCFHHTPNYWFALGLRNEPGSVWHMNLYSDTLCRSGLLERTHDDTPVDYIVGDCNHSQTEWYGVELYRASGSGSVTIEYEGGSNTWPPDRPWSWDSGDVIESFDHPRNAGARHNYGAWFEDLDVGLSIHHSVSGAECYQAKDEAVLRGGALADEWGVGDTESFRWTAPDDDDYGVFVWIKNDAGRNRPGFAPIIEEGGGRQALVPADGVIECQPSAFRRATTVSYQVPRSTHANVDIWDASGQRVRVLVDEVVPEGIHRAHWDGRDQNGRELPAGVYLCRLVVDESQVVTKMVKLE